MLMQLHVWQNSYYFVTVLHENQLKVDFFEKKLNEFA